MKECGMKKTNTNQDAARDAGHPLNRLRYHVTDAIERGDAVAIVERPAMSNYNRARANCSCRHHAFSCKKCEALKDTASRHTLKSLLSFTGHHCQPYGEGFQVFHEPGATTGDARYWSLTDAHVVGLLSGPSLHIIAAARAALAGKGAK
jgi:hypothetical protein